VTYHNLYFLHHVMAEIREGLRTDTFAERKEEFFRKYNGQ